MPRSPRDLVPSRRLPLTSALVALTGLSVGCTASADQPAAPEGSAPLGIRSDPLPPPRSTPGDPNQLAFDQARQADSNAALIQFLARNPDAAQADAARALLAARHQSDAGGIAESVAGVDADIVRAFDTARLSGVAALRAFAGQHRGHPLAAEARRMIEGG